MSILAGSKGPFEQNITAVGGNTVTTTIPVSGSVAVSSSALPSGAATSALQAAVTQQDGTTSEYCLRVMGLDVDAVSFFPIPLKNFGTTVPISFESGVYGAEVANAGTISSLGGTCILNTLSGYSQGIINIRGTYSATFIFEGLRDSIWYALPCSRVDSFAPPESSTGALVNASRAWRVNATGFESIRVRSTAYTSGSATISLGLFSLGQSNQNLSLQPTGQSTMANSQTVAIASDQSAVPVSGTITASNTAGNVAHDAADSGNPVKVGARARTSNITAVANDDRVDIIADRLGRQVVQPYTLDENVWTAVSASDITNTTSTAVKAATASTRYCITSITVSNMHATVSTRVDILDGSTVIWTGPAAALGGGYSITFPAPKPLTTNTAINAQCGTTGAAVRVAIAGFSIA